jgi:hypothetical protein
MHAPKWFLLAIGFTILLPFLTAPVRFWWVLTCLPFAAGVAVGAAWLESRLPASGSRWAGLMLRLVLVALVLGALVVFVQLAGGVPLVLQPAPWDEH